MFKMFCVFFRKFFHTVTHIFGSQEVKALSDLKGKLQEIINVQRPVNILLRQGDLVRKEIKTLIKWICEPCRLMIHYFFPCSLKTSLYLEMTPQLLAGKVSSPSRCLKKSWRSHCHWNHCHNQYLRISVFLPPCLSRSTILVLPPDEMPLNANIFVFTCIFHGILHIHDKVDKCLCLMAKEVQ